MIDKEIPDPGYRGDGSPHVEKARLDHVNGVLDDAVRNPPIPYQCGNLLGIESIDELLAENGFVAKESLNGVTRSGHTLYYMRRRTDDAGDAVIDILSARDLRTHGERLCYYQGLPYKSIEDCVKAVEDGRAFCRVTGHRAARSVTAVMGMGYGALNAFFLSSAESSFSAVLYGLTSAFFLYVSGKIMYSEIQSYFRRHKPVCVGTKEDPLLPIREALKIPYRASVKIRAPAIETYELLLGIPEEVPVASTETKQPAEEPALAELEERATEARTKRA